LNPIAAKWKEYYAYMEQEAGTWGSTMEEQKESSEKTVAVELTSEPNEDLVVDLDEEEEQPDEDEGDPEPEPELPPISNIERRDVKVLLIVREILRRQAAQAERKRNAEDIRQLDKSLYEIKPGSVTAYIVQVLSWTNDPIHINQIIAQIEGAGWNTTSTYLKYDIVRKALRDPMFEKVGRGMFRLRDGFRGIKPEKTEPPTRRDKIDTLTTLKDVAIRIAKTYQTERGIYPARLHFIMGRTGFSCAYSSVYRVMQCSPFVRDGMSYKVINDVSHNSAQSSDI
jgi:hypothetical protein